jgi:lysyl-tRNA synthetase class 1
MAKELSDIQKKALAEILVYIEKTEPSANGTFDGQAMHTELHAIKEKTGIEPREFFEAIYMCILARKSGPKAGWFLSVMDKNFLLKRLKEATA